MTNVNLDSSLPERRADERHQVRILATARECGRPPSRVLVTDLSEHGCRISGYALDEGSKVWIEFSSLSPIEAEVIWVSGDTAGCRFEEPLRPIQVILAEMSEAKELTLLAGGSSRRGSTARP
jgi:hypothetical protein